MRSDSHYRTLRDLKDRTVFSSLPTAIDGWLAAERVFRREGIDPTRLFARVVRRNNDYPDVVGAILSGRADMAVVPACLLETLGDEGLADVSGLRVLESEESKSAPVIPCRYSTELYPDISLLALPHAPSEMVRDMTIAILSLRNTAGAEWLTNVSHAGVDALLKELQLGPWAYLRDMSPAALYARHRTAFWLAAGLLLFLIFNELRLDRLVRRRTEDLRRSMAEQERLSAVAAATRTQLAMFERRSVVQQMSGMIAHEIKSPVGAIRNFAAVVKILLKDAIAQNPNARTAVEGIDAEALKIAGIVDRVRGYVKNRTANHVPADLKRAVDRGVRAFKLGKLASVPVLVQMPNEPATVLGDGLELELLVLNLVKNAAEAVHEQTDEHGRATGRVIVTLAAIRTETPPEGCGRRQWMLTVADNGRKLTEAEKACLMHSLESVKPDGLGLGLSIVRGIADSHGAKIEFVAKPAGGVVVSVLFDELDEEAAARAAGAIDAGRN